MSLKNQQKASPDALSILFAGDRSNRRLEKTRGFSARNHPANDIATEHILMALFAKELAFGQHGHRYFGTTWRG